MSAEVEKKKKKRKKKEEEEEKKLCGDSRGVGGKGAPEMKV